MYKIYDVHAAPPLRVEAERPLDDGTEWVVGCSTESVDSWAVAPSTESMDFWAAAPSTG